MPFCLAAVGIPIAELQRSERTKLHPDNFQQLWWPRTSSSLMGPHLIVLPDPAIKIGLQFVDQ